MRILDDHKRKHRIMGVLEPAYEQASGLGPGIARIVGGRAGTPVDNVLPQ